MLRARGAASIVVWVPEILPVFFRKFWPVLEKGGIVGGGGPVRGL
jgi:hypothetical protein